MIWAAEYECLTRAELRQLQLERLRETVARVYQQVPFYREAMDAKGVRPGDLASLADVRLLPLTSKDDLRRSYPFGLLAVPRRELLRVHASSGTTGKPTVVGYTRRDLETWSDLVARVAALAGVIPDDTAQVVFGYGLFTGAFGLHYGLEKLGATVVPASTGNSARQIVLMQDFETTVLVGTPSYAMHLSEVAVEQGVDPAALPVRLGLFGAEPASGKMRHELERRWGIKATDNYGLSEVIGPGVAGECECQQGLHLAEDHFLVEVLDPVTLEPVPDGQPGELVLTTLTREALPVLRYRTRDVASLNMAPCACGRTSARMSRVMGRTDDMLIIKGVNVFPSQIEGVLLAIDGVAPHYQIIASREGYRDELEVQVEVSEAFFSGRFADLKDLEEKIRVNLQTVLSLGAKVRLVEPRTLARSEGKAKRVVDLRNG